MAGFFGLFDYNKPGPGVPKDAPPKSPFVVFFEILQRKFWNLVKVNMMFLIFNLPALILGMLVMLMFFPNIFPEAMTDPDALLSDTMLKFILLSVIICIPMVTVGPAQAGFTYIMRNYAREEHAFLWSDFKDTALKNMKQSLIVGTINFIVTFLLLFSIRAYSALINLGQIPVIIGTVGFAIMILMLVLFACMNLYIYPILITFELSLKQMYKNALIFAVIKFLPNIGILLLSAFIIFLSFGMIIPFNPIIGFIPFLFITVSLIGFLTNFYAYPKLKKYIIAHLEEEEDEDEEEDEEEEGQGQDDNETDEMNEVAENASKEDNTGEDDIKRYF